LSVSIDQAVAQSGTTRASIVSVDTRGSGDLGAALAELSAAAPPVDELLFSVGAVFLRGLPVRTPEDFRMVAETYGTLWGDYRHGNSPRTAITDRVFTSTDYPSSYEISLHNELSYAASWPRLLFFCCLVAPGTGGQTHLCDGAAIAADLAPGLLARFDTLGVTYRQHLHGGFGIGKSWQDTYETDDQAEVETLLKAASVEFSWTSDNGLRTSQTRAGRRPHPVSGVRYWFNQAEQWHYSALPAQEAEALLAVVDGPEELPVSVSYGDGSPIAAEDLARIRSVSLGHALDVGWRHGDVLLVDNVRMQHGRRAYQGDRRVLVAMG
jgi:alpha-ketoglutarate-dependent taurine dioxygenase